MDMKRIDGRDYRVIYRGKDIERLERKHMDKLDPRRKRVIRSDLRKLWQNTYRGDFIKKVRVPYNGPGKYQFGVVCEFCNKHMGQSEKGHVTLASGKKSTKPKLLYQVDHIENTPPLETKDDIMKYTKSLFFGEMRILCYECHIKRVKSEKIPKIK